MKKSSEFRVPSSEFKKKESPFRTWNPELGTWNFVVCVLCGLWLVAPARGQNAAPTGGDQDMSAMFLKMSDVNLGPVDTEEQKKFIYTMQLEKARLSHRLLKDIYNNAFELYKKGNYAGASQLADKILAMDPGYEDAAVLKRASVQLKGSGKPFLSQMRLVDDRFQEGMNLYRQGRLVEASDKLEEASKLSPWNVKVRYWLGKVHKDLAEEHFERGARAYQQHRLSDALDQWYSALVLNPHYPRLVGMIARAEAQLREEKANESLQQALTLYGQGDTVNALRILDNILQTAPGDPKATQLMSEIRSEMASQHVEAGRQLFKQAQYEKAVAEFHKAADYGYDPKETDLMISRAKEAERREEEAKRLAAEHAKEKAEAAAKRKADEEAAAKKKAEDEAKAKEQAAAQAPAAAPAAPAAPAGPSESAKKEAQQHYLNGVVAFQQGNYQKARDEWMQAKQLDPTNADVQAGLDKINRLIGGQ